MGYRMQTTRSQHTARKHRATANSHDHTVSPWLGGGSLPHRMQARCTLLLAPQSAASGQTLQNATAVPKSAHMLGPACKSAYWGGCLKKCRSSKVRTSLLTYGHVTAGASPPGQIPKVHTLGKDASSTCFVLYCSPCCSTQPQLSSMPPPTVHTG